MGEDRVHGLPAIPVAVARLGYTREELLTLRIDDIVAGESAWTASEFARFGRQGEWYGERELRRKDGVRIPVEVRATVVALPDGSVNIAALRDMSERQAIQRQQQEFLEAASHDLKNPLAAVRLQVQWPERMARQRAMDPERLRQGLEAIANASERMAAQLEELRDVVRLRSGDPLELRPSRSISSRWQRKPPPRPRQRPTIASLSTRRRPRSWGSGIHDGCVGCWTTS